jgi:urease accessory protein UreH
LVTQSSTKAYRGTTRQRTSIRIDEGAAAIVVPDPIVAYRDATFVQTTDIDLSGSLVSCDTITAGRVAHGERWAATSIDSTLVIRRDGRVRLRDRLVLDRSSRKRSSTSTSTSTSTSPHPDSPGRSSLYDFDAIATCVVVGPRVDAKAILARVAELPARGDVLIAASPLYTDGVIVKIAGASIESVIQATRAHLLPACHALGEDPWARKW